MAALAAILRAARPSYRDDADRLAFAAHALMLSLGYGLTATGQDADGDAPLDPQAPEVGPENWQSLPDGAYAFRYARAAESSSSSSASAPGSKNEKEKQQEQPKAMLVRASTAGDALAVAWCKGDDGGAVVPVASVVLPFGEWLLPPSSPSPSSSSSSSSGDPTARFKDLAKLEAHLKDALERGVGLEGEKKKEKEGGREDDGGEEGAVRGAGGSSRPPQPEHYPRPPPPQPVPSIGADDLYPPGLGPGMPGIAHPFPGGGIGVGGIGGSSSQVGPDHPLFGARRPGMGPPGGPRNPPVPGLPPGARWDPIGPPGTPGFLPGDFRPPGQGGGGGGGRGRGRGAPPPLHPDIMPPGPGGPFSGGGGGGFSGGFI